MLFFGDDEEKRSRLWRIVTVSATVLILIVAGYFLGKGFFGNPLKGTWKQDESEMTLEIRGGDKAVLCMKDTFPEGSVTLDLDYTLNTRGKQITFHADQKELEEAAKALGESVTEQELQTAVEPMLTSFNYSLDGRELSLNEWDFGEQFLFTKIR